MHLHFGIAFPVELFIMHAVDADGSIRSELGAAEEWVGKVKVVTDVVSREIRILEKAMSQMDRQTKEEILQISNTAGNDTIGGSSTLLNYAVIEERQNCGVFNV